MLNKLKKCKRPLACILVIIMMASFIVPYATNLLKIKADGEAITVKGSNRWTYSGHTRYVWRGQQDGLLYFCSEPGRPNSNPGIKKLIIYHNHMQIIHIYIARLQQPDMH